MPEILDFAIGTIIGNISTAIVLTLVYYNFILFEDYFRVIIWAFLFSQALRGAKEKICRLLRYLSRGKEIQRDGLLYTIWSQAIPYFLYSSHPADAEEQTTAGIQKDKVTLLILDNGIFIFAWISAVSIYVRTFSLLSFLQLSLGILAIASLALWILDRRVFYYRLFLSDEVLVSALLISGCFVIGFFVLFYLGTESFMEGSLAASHVSSWVQKNVINDERTRTIWSEQVTNGKAMVASAIHSIEGSYNNTMWFGPLKAMIVAYYDTPTDQQPQVSTFLSLPPNMTWVEAISLAYAQFSDFNLTTVEVSDLTSKGLELSSLAVGSVIQLVLVIVTFVVAFVSIGLKSFFFLTSLFYLLCAKWDPVERIVNDLIPIAPEKRPAMVDSLRRAIEGVFFLPMKISSLHAIVSLVSFSAVGTDFVFLGTLMSFFISIVPVVPPYLICLPYVCLRLSTSLVPAILLFVVHYFAFTWIDQVLYERSLTSINAYISALSVAFGVYVFGLEGVVFGPLLVCGVNWTYEISNHGIQAATSDEDESLPASVGSDNIFSSAYKALSGGLRGNLARQFSVEAATPENSICVDLEVHIDSHDSAPYVVRFIARKEWSYEQMLKHMRQTLKVWNVRGIYAKKNNAQILSVEHLFPRELVKVVVQEEPTSNNEEEHRLKTRLKLSPGANCPSLVTPPRSRRSSFSPRPSLRWSDSSSSSNLAAAENEGSTASNLHLDDDEKRSMTPSLPPHGYETYDEFHSAVNSSLHAAIDDFQPSPTSDRGMESPMSPAEDAPSSAFLTAHEEAFPTTDNERVHPPTSPINVIAEKVPTLRQRKSSGHYSPDDEKVTAFGSRCSSLVKLN
ncbi:hypothetical protein AeNC1_003546 [Aphanomyces euteiches]|nr:hypothetical protein AeNC1_003546 [Aphanomyces euteiches]